MADAVDLLKAEQHDTEQAESLRAQANSLLVRLDEIADERADGLLTGKQAQRATERINAKLAAIEHQQQDAERVRVFRDLPLGTPEAVDAVRQLSPDRFRAVVDVLMSVAVAPVGKSGKVFNPERVRGWPGGERAAATLPLLRDHGIGGGEFAQGRLIAVVPKYRPGWRAAKGVDEHAIRIWPMEATNAATTRNGCGRDGLLPTNPTYDAMPSRSDAWWNIAPLGHIGGDEDRLQTLLTKIATDKEFRNAVTVSADEKLIEMKLQALHLARNSATALPSAGIGRRQHRLRSRHFDYRAIFRHAQGLQVVNHPPP